MTVVLAVIIYLGGGQIQAQPMGNFTGPDAAQACIDAKIMLLESMPGVNAVCIPLA